MPFKDDPAALGMGEPSLWRTSHNLRAAEEAEEEIRRASQVTFVQIDSRMTSFHARRCCLGRHHQAEQQRSHTVGRQLQS